MDSVAEHGMTRKKILRLMAQNDEFFNLSLALLHQVEGTFHDVVNVLHVITIVYSPALLPSVSFISLRIRLLQ